MLLLLAGGRLLVGIVKEDAFRALVAPRYAVLGVVDDRTKAVRMWRRLGLICLQVAEGDF